MASVEDRVGQLLQAAVPPSDGVAFEDVVRRVRRRRNARWSVAGLVAVVGAAAGVVLLTVPGEHRSNGLTADGVDLTGTVPWADLPVQPYIAPSASPTSAPATDARACTAADLQPSLGEAGAATGHYAVTVRFRNVGATTCLLAGTPQATATSPGRPDVRSTGSAFIVAPGPSANMPPGGETLMFLELDNLCAARPDGAGGLAPYQHVDIAIPGGGSVGLDSGTSGFDVTCGLQVSSFYVEPAAAQEPHDPLSDLQASLEMPSSAAAGGTLVYVVALTNPTDQPIDLDRCPSYVAFGDGLKDAHQLNCAAAAPIAPGGTERFEMRVQVPEGATGPLAVTWSVAAPFDVSARGTVDVS